MSRRSAATGCRSKASPPEELVVAHPKTLHLTEVQHLAKERPIDIAFISMKSYDTEWATTMIRQYLAPTGYVVSLQNCINEERSPAIVGWGRTVGAIAAILSAELYAPGKIRRTGAKNPPGHEVYRVGEVHGRITPADRGTGRDDPHRRHLQGHRQSVGRALVEAVRQRHA